MAPGSFFLIKEIDRANPFVYANKLHDMVVNKDVGHEISQGKMKKLLVNTGFNILSEGKKLMLWYPHYWFLAEKPNS